MHWNLDWHKEKEGMRMEGKGEEGKKDGREGERE
jgi:hypothetical protein